VELIDTVARDSNAYRVLQPPAFTNQYAALPSLHFGWNLLVGIVLVRQSRRLAVKLLGWMSPPAMALATILTANHYVIDVVAGALFALAGLLIAWYLRRLRRSRGLTLRHRGVRIPLPAPPSEGEPDGYARWGRKPPEPTGPRQRLPDR
jgi:membrane-associated phospholipid phosphatase